MKTYAIYNSTGVVVKQVQCLDGELDNYLHDDLSAIETNESPFNKRVENGVLIEIEAVEEPPAAPLIESLSITDQRNAKLHESDWTQFADSPLSDTKKAEWATYRQALRDLPQQYPDAITNDDIIWPTKPR
jgi:hypothetical protein